MTTIMRNDGTWKSKPSGLKKGNLSAWRDMMFAARAFPKTDDIVVDRTEDGEIIGYLCIVPNGYNSYWKRVAKQHRVISGRCERPNSGYQPQGGYGGGYQPPGSGHKRSPLEKRPDAVFYTKRAIDNGVDDDRPF